MYCLCNAAFETINWLYLAVFAVCSLSRYDVANLKVRLGEYDIKQAGETEIFESKAARVVRHKEFSQQTLVRRGSVLTFVLLIILIFYFLFL